VGYVCNSLTLVDRHDRPVGHTPNGAIGSSRQFVEAGRLTGWVQHVEHGQIRARRLSLITHLHHHCLNFRLSCEESDQDGFVFKIKYVFGSWIRRHSQPPKSKMVFLQPLSAHPLVSVAPSRHILTALPGSTIDGNIVYHLTHKPAIGKDKDKYKIHRPPGSLPN
jgi:hypothetical protein